MNVRVDLKVSESGASGEQATKTVTLTAADREGTQVRSVSVAGLSRPPQQMLRINVDATPEIVAGDKVRLSLGLEYELTNPDDEKAPVWQLNQRLHLVLQDGKPLVVSSMADPRSSRHAVVEVTATVLR
ncbi:MAG: hypothetical protein KGN76_01740 [Acidobacteriota bacterium]|nr:hypothetical protein [Acidobacteriota bacterium]